MIASDNFIEGKSGLTRVENVQMKFLEDVVAGFDKGVRTTEIFKKMLFDYGWILFSKDGGGRCINF